tara:strand:- start:82 stop:396 length:315 start_codon:yes stop_codon:yes gene_type:complete
MSKASEKLLGELHGAVAKVLTDQVLVQEEVQELDLEGVPVGTGEMEFTASPATLATAIKFLKDNSITCDIKVDKNMGNLAEALGKKQRHSRLNDGKAAALQEVH